MRVPLMAGRKIELELPDELFDQLGVIADAIGIASAVEAAMIAVAEWVSRRKSELDDRDPEQKYFVNDALDELMRRKKDD